MCCVTTDGEIYYLITDDWRCSVVSESTLIRAIGGSLSIASAPALVLFSPRSCNSTRSCAKQI